MSRICRVACGSTAVPAGDCTADGFWHCVSCHVSFANNTAATTHEARRPGHQLAWWCFAHNRLELIATPAAAPSLGASA